MLSTTKESFTSNVVYTSGPTLNSSKYPMWNLGQSQYTIQQLRYPLNSSQPWEPTPPTFASVMSMLQPEHCANTRLSVQYDLNRLQVSINAVLLLSCMSQGSSMEWTTPPDFGYLGDTACAKLLAAFQKYQHFANKNCPYTSEGDLRLLCDLS